MAKKIIWKNNVTIPRADLAITLDTIQGWYSLQSKTIGKKIIKNTCWVHKNGDLIATYVPKDDLRNIALTTLETIIKKPDHIDKIHKKTIAYNKAYFGFAEKVRRMDLSAETNTELFTLHKKLFGFQMISHCYSQPTTWFVDCEDEILSSYLTGILRKHSEESGLNSDIPTAFSILTTNGKKTFAQDEEKESLHILEIIKQDKKTNKWFKENTTEFITEKINETPSHIKKSILSHYRKWHWLPYTYIGPAYSLDYYIDIWRGLLHEGAEPKELVRNIETQNKTIQQQRKKIIKDFNLSAHEKHLFDIAADIVWLKGFRKDCYFHGFFVRDIILTEIAKRSGLTLMQAKFLTNEEIKKALNGNDFADVANERYKFNAIIASADKFKIFTGKHAHTKIKSLNIEKVKVEKVSELKGTCACPGKATGEVKIVNFPDDMKKMNSGDIMLAHATYPALVPAMKKAAAIFTEEGGITCHAAIVARELQTPCVVGCKNALDIFKDGDMVEVDAVNGIIKLVKKSK